MATVIVFGPTGQIGSVAARTAADCGAKVWLAMRDTNKAIPGIDKDSKGSFERIQADLEKPDTMKRAAKTSGAKRAFVYLNFAAKDHMKAAFEALKAGGVEFVVFLSSFTIHVNEPLRDIPSSEVIPYVHAQAEASLDDVYGDDHYVAIRPGGFASNLLGYAKGIAAGEVSLYSGVFEQDNISPSDIGRVSGTVLATGPKNGQKKVYVYGPEIRSMEDSILEIGKILNKDIKINHLSKEETYKGYIDGGMADYLANYMIKVHSTPGPDKGSGERFPKYDEGVNNIKLYTGQPSMNLENWVEENKAALQ